MKSLLEGSTRIFIRNLKFPWLLSIACFAIGQPELARLNFECILNYINLPGYYTKPETQLWRLFEYKFKTKIMETINLNIPNMRSSHCQMTVTQTVKSLGATVKSIAPTQAEIELANGLTRDAVVIAIEQAGYRVQAN